MRHPQNPPEEYSCSKCPRLITKGRVCGPCRLRDSRGSIVEGAACRAPECGISDARVLRRHRFADGVAILCANHDAIAGRRARDFDSFVREVTPPPPSVAPVAARPRPRPRSVEQLLQRRSA